MNPDEQYEDLSERTRMITLLLWLTAAVWAVIAMLLLLNIARNMVDSSHGIVGLEMLAVIPLSLLRFVLFVITAWLFTLWIIQANKNVRAMGARDLPDSPGWAAGWFFVPVLNLWKPSTAMENLAKASDDASDWQSIEVRAHVYMWWNLWLTSFIFIYFGSYIVKKLSPDDFAMKLIWVKVGGVLIHIALCYTAGVLISTITRAQQSQHALAEAAMKPKTTDLPPQPQAR